MNWLRPLEFTPHKGSAGFNLSSAPPRRMNSPSSSASPPQAVRLGERGASSQWRGLTPPPRCQSVQGPYPFSRGDTACDSNTAVVSWDTTIPRDNSCSPILLATGEGRPRPASRGKPLPQSQAQASRADRPIPRPARVGPYPGHNMMPASSPGQSLANNCQREPVLPLSAR